MRTFNVTHMVGGPRTTTIQAEYFKIHKHATTSTFYIGNDEVAWFLTTVAIYEVQVDVP